MTDPESYYRIPIVFEQGKHGERAYDIYSWLAKKGQIFINGILTTEMADCVSAQLLAASEKAADKIELLIDSPGGNVRALFTLMDAIDMFTEKTDIKIATSCIGMAGSAAAILLLYGSPGYRSATRRSTIMLHDMSFGFGAIGSSKDVSRQYDEAQRLRQELRTTLLNRTNITEEDIDNYLDRDEYIDVYMGKQLGLIDEIKESF